jgi:hypothetical protein
MKNTENKFWFAEKNSDAYTHILTVDVYNRWDGRTHRHNRFNVLL